mmetsp:Transcript_94817/g.267882  ORF Transcript_94817/g.267882 Transcript_94817/m.267882 type:complete len:282 (+) Transcript_94817:137-982(+)
MPRNLICSPTCHARAVWLQDRPPQRRSRPEWRRPTARPEHPLMRLPWVPSSEPPLVSPNTAPPTAAALEPRRRQLPKRPRPAQAPRASAGLAPTPPSLPPPSRAEAAEGRPASDTGPAELGQQLPQSGGAPAAPSPACQRPPLKTPPAAPTAALTPPPARESCSTARRQPAATPSMGPTPSVSSRLHPPPPTPRQLPSPPPPPPFLFFALPPFFLFAVAAEEEEEAEAAAAAALLGKTAGPLSGSSSSSAAAAPDQREACARSPRSRATGACLAARPAFAA